MAAEPGFELISEIHDGVWTAASIGQPQAGRFLARQMREYQRPSQGKKGARPVPDMSKTLEASSVLHVLNHENLVSLVGRVRAQQKRGRGKRPPAGADFLVWDFCEAGNLETLLGWIHCESTAYHLPESLCWHVVRALVRAVTYLHDGKRLVASQTAGHEWRMGDCAWTPILHRAIEPRNIFFQHPRGHDTYGPCKLGGFGHAAVTGHVVHEDGGEEQSWPCSIAVTVQRGWEPLEETRPKLARSPDRWKPASNSCPWPDGPPRRANNEDGPAAQDARAYTLSDEIWAIGSVCLTMMSGVRVGYFCRDYGCAHVSKCSEGGCLQSAAVSLGCQCIDGGCEHMVGSWACTHDVSDWQRARHPACEQPVVNMDVLLARARYSCWLRSSVRSLLDFDPDSKLVTPRAQPFADLVEANFARWRAATAEGRRYVG